MTPSSLTGLTPRERDRLLERIREKRRSPLPAQPPIAIVGMACRFPGASNLNEFWANLKNGVSSISEIPASRFAVEDWFDAEPAVPGKMNTRWGGFIPHADEFDCGFFGVSADEARAMDPQQRILLETAAEALDHAGFDMRELRGSLGAVYAGAGSQDYGHELDVDRHPRRIDPYYGTGNSMSFLSARIARYLGIHGPVMTVDTACSASLVAIHLACQALRSRECDWALAGGVNLILRPAGFVYVSQIRAVASDGKCKAFSRDADGYVRGEGCGLIVLKRLEDAAGNGDRILAVIRASAVNHDGRSSSLTAPNGRAQLALLKRALAQSGLEGSQVGYVEAHGTGTPLGDPIEVRALCEALRGPDPAAPLVLGSVKTNIGHLEAAAGVAGVIKTVLMLRNQVIPPHVNFDSLSPHLEGLPVRIPLAEEPWTGEERYAGVSSFGIGGTNAHVVLGAGHEQAAEPAADERDELLALSGRDQADLDEQSREMAQWLRVQPEASLGAIAFAMGSRRSGGPVRRAVVGRTRDEWCEQLEEAPAKPMVSSGKGWVWVYSGQGGSDSEELSERWEELQGERWFREELEAWEREIEERTGWRIGPWLRGQAKPSGSLWQKQLVKLVWQMGVTAQLRGWGLEAGAVVGHSVGEVAAAVAAGAMDRGQGVEVVWRRGLLLEKLQGLGGMVAVRQQNVSEEPVGLSLAARNGPSWKVWSGPAEALEQWYGKWQQQGLEVRWIDTMGVAGHGPEVEQGARELERELAGQKWSEGLRIPMRSTVTGEWLKSVDATYWRRNLRETVRFDLAIQGLIEEGFRQFVEVGAQPVLGGAIEEQLESVDQTGQVQWSLRRGETARRSLLEVAGRAYESGQALAWANVTSTRAVADLPPISWRRQSYWFSDSGLEFPAMLREKDLATQLGYQRAYDRVLAQHCPEGAHAINRRHLAPDVFLGCEGAAFFFCAHLKGSIVALLYAGHPSNYGRLLSELEHYTRSRHAGLLVMAVPAQADSARNRRYSTTPIGVRQFLPKLADFHLDGAPMRRLRYLVEKYKRLGGCAIQEAGAGEANEIDGLIAAWIARKGIEPAFIADARREIRHRRGAATGLRTFITRRDGRAECAILLSPAPQNGGYLMDLEFYGADTPLGCLEYSIVEIIRQLSNEGSQYFSLGGAYGAGLEPHPAEHPEIARLLAELHSANVLNGDSNVQFKNKFCPATEPLFLCCPEMQDAAAAQDVLRVLSGRAEAQGSQDFLLERLDVPGRSRIFAQALRDGDWIRSHAVHGIPVAPGSYYIDAALRAACAALSQPALMLENFVIERPVRIEPQGAAEIRIVVDREETVEIHTRGAAEWVRLAVGRCRPLPGNSAGSFCPIDFQKRALALDPGEFYRDAEQAGVEYGDLYRVIRQLWISRDRGEALAWIETSATGLGPFFAHPALLDGALQTISAARGYDLAAGGTCRLQAIDSIELHRPLPRGFWAVAKLAGGNDDAVSADLELWGAEGLAIGCLRGVCARVTPQAKSSAPRRDVPFYRIEWTPAVDQSPGDPQVESRRWVVLASPLLRQKIEAALASLGQSVVDRPAPGQPVEGVIHALGESSTVELIADLRTTCQSLLDWPEQPRLWLLTRGAQPVRDELPDPQQAAAWGYGRVFGMEHPGAWGGLVDVDPALDDLTAALAQVVSGAAESETAWRAGRCFVPRLMRAPDCEPHPVAIRDGCYLVAGGTRGAGLATAQWLGRQGASHIVVAGREGAPGESHVRVETEVAQWGRATVYAARADVTSEAQMRGLFAWMHERMPALRGIVFAAAAIEDGAVARQPEEAVRRVLLPKVEGSALLERLTAGLNLDFVVFYSSAAVLLAPPGQSAYAAANAYMDALAHRLNGSRGCRVLAVNWGHWLNTGSADSPALAERLRFQGIAPFSVERALEALPQMLARPEPQLTFLDIHWDRWQSGLPACRSKLWARLLTAHHTGDIEKIASVDGDPVDIESAVLRRIRRIAGARAVAASMDSNLKDLGFDSLTLINLRNQLEGDLRVRVPIAALFQCANVRGLCDTIRERESQLAVEAVAG